MSTQSRLHALERAAEEGERGWHAGRGLTMVSQEAYALAREGYLAIIPGGYFVLTDAGRALLAEMQQRAS